jgi:uncharacterized membrane protein
VFVFLAGVSSYLYGVKRNKKQLSFFLLTRGIWLVFLELFVLGLFRTFDLSFTYFNLQVIWAIGVSMMALSAIIYMNRLMILLIGVLLIAGHNLLDTIHIEGNSFPAFLWSILHDAKYFTFGRFLIHLHYPVLPWIGLLTIGYFLGSLYAPGYDASKRRKILLSLGITSLVLFLLLRFDNWYGDAAKWFPQKNAAFTLLSFLNVTKYPPSLLYLLITMGPALIFLALTEKPLNTWKRTVVTYGRVPMFYYLAHILLIHSFAAFAGLITGHPEMTVLNTSVNNITALKGYGFSLTTVYIIWIALVLLLYPFCRWFERYKRNHQGEYWWLSYL